MSVSNILMIKNEGPYGSERSNNALRLAMNLVRRESTKVRIFSQCSISIDPCATIAAE